MGRNDRQAHEQETAAAIREAVRQSAIEDGYELLEMAEELREEAAFQPTEEELRRAKTTIAARLLVPRLNLRRGALIPLVAAVIMLASTILVAAFWEDINRAWVDFKNNLAGFGPASSTGQSIQWSAYHSPAYLPPGFQYVNGYEVENGVIRFYRNPEGVEFTLRELSVGTSSTLDGDNGERQQIVRVNGAEAVLSLGKTVTLTWGSSPVFVLQGPLDYRELLRIAESIPISGTYPGNTRYE